MQTIQQVLQNHYLERLFYGIDVKYLVEVSLSGANKFKELGTVNNLKLINVTNFDLDKLLLSVGGTIGVQGNFDIRVSAITKLVDPGLKIFCNCYFQTTPYQLSSFIYAPGGYQGWNPGTANTLVSATSNGTYFGFINFPAAGTGLNILKTEIGMLTGEIMVQMVP